MPGLRIALGFFLLLLVGATPALAHPIDDYLVMVDKAIAQPRQADYLALRKAYYAILAAPEDQRRRQMADDVDAAKKSFDEARGRRDLDAAERYLKVYLRLTFGSVLNQRAAAVFFEKERSNPSRSAEHRWIADQMLLAITRIGDGKSPQTAYQATSVREEYLVLEHLGLQSRGQTLITDKGRHYDVLRGVPAKSPGAVEVPVYFEVDSFF